MTVSPASNRVWIGRACLIVKGDSLPNGYNQRPGITLLLADGDPLVVEIEGLGVVQTDGMLLAPQIKRRFTFPQPHFSITVEPGHPSYIGLLRIARQAPHHSHLIRLSHDQLQHLAALTTQRAFNTWLEGVVEAHGASPTTQSPRLDFLLSLIEKAEIEASAEHIWAQYRERFPSTQAHCSHWLQDAIGVPLRKLLLWQKLRRALEALHRTEGATEVAHAAGFADSAHLSRICMRTFGLRPSQANDHKILQVFRFPDY